MRGTVGVESQLGVGSTFWFTVLLGKALPLPPSDTTQAVRHATQDLSLCHRNARFLLVEDEPFNQEITQEMLHEEGMAADLAANGAEAVEMAHQKRYDLILMDMQMPIMDGVEATQRIRKIPGYEHTPIVAMTANAFHEDKQRCLAAGMNEHVAKPVEPDQLFRVIAKLLCL